MEEQLLGNCMRLIITEGLTANRVSDYTQKTEALFASDSRFDSVVLDLSSTKNIDSVGVTFVIGLYKASEEHNKSFSVSGASVDIMSLFRLMKLDQFFDLNE